jgi:Ser/Thr protein kinase RdoA (MazF antagonist)
LGDGKVFLRITNTFHKPYEKILGELEWVEFLSTRGICVSRPYRSSNGDLAEQMTADGNHFTVVCFEEAKGRPVSSKDHSGHLFKLMGIFMGQMHVETKNYENKNLLTKRPDWLAETDKVLSIELPKSEKDIVKRYVDLREYISTLSKSRDSYGLIHADFHFGNFFIDGDSICLFDFDACRYSWFVDDIAIAIFFATAVRSSSYESNWFYSMFIEGYRTKNDLDEEWIVKIPYFIKLREIGRYIKLYHACDGEFEKLHPWGKTFMKDRREAILNSIPL